MYVKNELVLKNVGAEFLDKILHYIHMADSDNIPATTKVWDYFLELSKKTSGSRLST